MWLYAMMKLLFPTLVVPLDFVPLFTVTYSLITLLFPMRQVVSSPLYVISWGGPPSEAKGWMVQELPIVVRPSTATWLMSLVPAPITTFPPITQ